MKEETKIIGTVEVNFKDGKREVKMELKNPQELYNCEEGKAVVLILHNEEEYTGIFKGMDEDDVMLGSLSGEYTVGLNVNAIATYFEETDEDRESIERELKRTN